MEKNFKLLRARMKEYGYTDTDIDKILNHRMLKNRNAESLCTSIDDVIEILRELWLSYEDIIKITTSSPALFSLRKDVLRRNVDGLPLSNPEELATALKRFPPLLSLNADHVAKRITDLEELGYDTETIKNITINTPQLYGLNMDYFLDKKYFYNSIGLNGIFSKVSGSIMQSLELTYARYKFFESIGIEINMDNCEILFEPQNVFVEKYGKTNSQLIEEYPLNIDALRMRRENSSK